MGNKAQKARIEAMKQQIELRGGSVGIMPGASDDLVEFFLREVLDCPECRAELEEMGDAPFPRPRRRRGH